MKSCAWRSATVPAWRGSAPAAAASVARRAALNKSLNVRLKDFAKDD